jgi:hypothetical protein
LEKSNNFSSITQRLVSELQQRDKKGQAKYGTTLDRTDLTRLEWLQHAKEEALDLACYLERLIVEESGENTLPTPHPPPSNATEISLPQMVYDLTKPESMDEKEFRAFWNGVLARGGTLYASMLKNIIETWQGMESLKPDGDPVEKLKTIQYMQATDPGLFERMLKEVGAENHINVTFKDVTPKPRNN